MIMEGNSNTNYKLVFAVFAWCSLLASNFILYKEVKALKGSPSNNNLRLRRDLDQDETNKKVVDVKLTVLELRKLIRKEMNFTLHKFIDRILDKKINQLVKRNVCKESSKNKKIDPVNQVVYRTCESKGEIKEPGQYTFHFNWKDYKTCRWDIKLNRPFQIKIKTKLYAFSQGCVNRQVRITETDSSYQPGICQRVGNETTYESKSGNVVLSFDTNIFQNEKLNIKKISLMVT